MIIHQKHKIFLLLADILIFILFLACFNLTYFSINKTYTFVSWYEYSLISIFWMSCLIINFFLQNMYKYQILLDKGRQIYALSKSFIYSSLLVIVFAFILKFEYFINHRYLFGLFLVMLYFVYFLLRVFVAPSIYFYLVKSGTLSRNLLIYGAGVNGRKIARLLLSSNRNYFNIVGFIDDENTKINQEIDGIPVLGTKKNLEIIIKRNRINDVFIAINNISYPNLLRIIDICKKNGRTVHVASDLYKIVPEKLDIEEIAGTIFFRLNPMTSERLYYINKKLIDTISSLAIIIIFCPLWFLIITITAFSFRGKFIYKATVIGKNKKPFVWYKFRTMRVITDDTIHKKLIKEIILNGQSGEKLNNDPRITKVGKWLRKYSFDEIPQLINVLKGDMSLVGPRPKLPYEFELMEDWQKRRFLVTPGITGIWQIRGRNEVKFNDEIVMDLFYIENRSIKLDIEIIIKTIPIILFGKTGK